MPDILSTLTQRGMLELIPTSIILILLWLTNKVAK